MKNSFLKTFYVCTILFFCTIFHLQAQNCGSDSGIQFLEEKVPFSLLPTCPLVYQSAYCGSKIYTVCVCFQEDEPTPLLKVEISLEFAKKLKSFEFTDPMDFTFNTQTGKLEAFVDFSEGFTCKTLQFAGKSLNYEPVTKIIATLFYEDLPAYQDCIITSGDAVTTPLVNTSISAAISNPIPPQIPLSNNSTNVSVYVEGTLTVDQDYNFGEGSNILMGDDAKIVVKSGVTLVIGYNWNPSVKDKCRIFACNKMWESIIVEDGGSLIVLNTDIRDARKAITVENQGFLGAGKVTFEDNIIGVYQKEGNVTASIDECLFTKKYGLKEPSNDPLIGIKTEDLTFVDIFKTTFTDIAIGVDASMSSVNSYSSVYDKLKFGIKNVGKSDDFSGNTYSNRDVFENIKEDAVHSFYGHSTFVDLANMNKVGIGINATSLPFYPSWVEVLKSNIANADRAIFANNNRSLIESNSFLDNHYDIYTNNVLKPSSGADIYSNTSTSDHPLRFGILSYSGVHNVLRNEIIFNGPANLTDGMSFSGTKRSNIQGNSIDVEGNAFGVSFYGCSKANFGCNTIDGNNSPDNGLTYHDLYVEQTGSASNFYGNTIRHGEDGMTYNGASVCGIGGNTVRNQNSSALHIRSNGIVGEQEHEGNLFLPEASSIAVCENDVKYSEFIVSARHTNNTCIKVATRIPNTYTSNWFKDECEKPNQSTYDPASNCSSFTKPPTIITNLDTKVLDGSTTFTGTYGPPLTYITKKQFYKTFSEDPTLQNGNAVAAEFIVANQQNVIGKLYEVERLLQELDNTPTKELLEDKLSTIKTAYKELDNKNEALAELTADEQKTALLLEKKVIILQINTLNQEIQGMSSQIIAYRQQQLATIDLLNKSIETNQDIDANEKIINQLIIDALIAQKTTFNNSDLGVISNIANKCPFSDGDAVYTARSILALKYPGQRYDNDVACGNVVSRVAKKKSETILRVSPNPSYGDFTTTCILPDDTKEANLEVINSLGVVVASQIADGSSNLNFWNLEDLPNGFYTILLKANGKIVQQQKVVITK